MKKILLIIFLLVSSSFANVDKHFLENIIKMTMAVDGTLSKKMYQDFWNELRRNASTNEIKAITLAFKKSIITSSLVSRETWRSALKSYVQEKIVKTKELENLISQNFNNVINSNPYEKGTKEYNSFFQAFTKRHEQSIRNINSLLYAAAHKQEMKTQDGRVIKVDKKMITQVLNGIDNSFKRIDILFDANAIEKKLIKE